MAGRINDKLTETDTLAKKGLQKCKLDSERKVWLYTFSDPFTTAKNVSARLGISPNTARNALKTLADRKLLFSDTEIKRNKKYRNYDLMRILRE